MNEGIAVKGSEMSLSEAISQLSDVSFEMSSLVFNASTPDSPTIAERSIAADRITDSRDRILGITARLRSVLGRLMVL